MPNRPTPEQVERLRPYVKSGFLDVVQELAKKMTAPYWWYDSSLSEEGRVVGGGTMCFVDTGEKLLGITAGHIHTAYLRARQLNPALWCQVGAHSFDPERCLVDFDDQSIDLAVYAVTEVQVSAIGSDIHRPIVWPPEVEGTLPVLVGGWPWHLASSEGPQTHHSFLHFLLKLSDHTERSLIAVVGPSTSVPWGSTALPEGTNLGGMSGGPVYELHERRLSVLTLVGIISEYHSSFETVRATPLSLVDSQGHILR